MTKLRIHRLSVILFLFSAAAVTPAPAQSPTFFTTLAAFDLDNGSEPYYMSLVQGNDGSFYGTTVAGGVNNGNDGTVFQITPAGTLTTLYSFCQQGGNCVDGRAPYVGLVQASDGNFYGTTVAGGTSDWGTVFKITPSGTLTTLHSFDGADGGSPWAALVQASDGNFYGTTALGGVGYGTVFKITPAGSPTTLYSFCQQGGGCADGTSPHGALVQGSDRNLYGTTTGGGAGGHGTVFRITTDGTLTTLHSFNGLDGGEPVAALLQASDGNFYGTTLLGGPSRNCGDGCGAIFKITSTGTFTPLYIFCSQPNCADGANPSSSLVQGADGNFYGTTWYGGDNTNCGGGCGTVFDITPGGTLTTLYRFCPQSGCRDGYWPLGGLLQATNGAFYGTTFAGGQDVWGTVFRIGLVRNCAGCRP